MPTRNGTCRRQALADAQAMSARDERPGVLAEAERSLSRTLTRGCGGGFSQGERRRARQHPCRRLPRQTVLHRPERRLTVQIGDGAWLAKAVGLPVVYDLRAADVAAGGQGAPLVPVYHRALAQRIERPGPVCVVNIGGVSNITYRRQRPDRLRCRARQRAARRLHAEDDRQGDRS